MADESTTTAECNGLDISVLGCLSTGYWGLDAIIVIVPVLFGLWLKLLEGETWRVRVGLWLWDASWSTAYASLLQKLLVRLRWFFGLSWSRHALDACFRLAVIYGMAYLFFQRVMSTTPGIMDKLIFGGLFFVAGLVNFIFARLIRRRHLRARSKAGTRKQRKWLYAREHSAYLAVGLAGIAITALSIKAGLDAIAASVIAAGGGAGAVAGAGVVATVAGIAGAVIVLAIGIIGAGAEAGDVRVAVGFFALVFIIPWLNALFDWPSWAASRWLMRRLQEDATRPGFLRRAVAILAHLLLDGVIAIACLFGLAIVLINLTHGVDAPQIWEETLNAAKATPFSAQGSTMTVMLLTTLVPTALHLFFALFALAVIRPPYREWFVGWIDDRHGEDSFGNRAIVSAYLTFWLVFALAVLWGAAMALIHGLDWVWLRVGWGLDTDPYPFWASIFRAAEAFVIL